MIEKLCALKKYDAADSLLEIERSSIKIKDSKESFKIENLQSFILIHQTKISEGLQHLENNALQNGKLHLGNNLDWGYLNVYKGIGYGKKKMPDSALYYLNEAEMRFSILEPKNTFLLYYVDSLRMLVYKTSKRFDKEFDSYKYLIENKEYSSFISNKTRGIYYQGMALTSVYLDQLENAEQYYELSDQEYAKNISDNLKESIALKINKSSLLKTKGLLKKAESELNEAIDLIKDNLGTENKFFGFANTNLGAVYYDQGRFSESILTLEKAKLTFDAIKLDKNNAVLYLNMANCHADLGNHTDANMYYNEAIKTSLEMDDKEQLNNVYLNYGRYQFEVNEYEKSIECLDLAIKYGIEIFGEDSEALIMPNIDKGEVFLHLKKYDSALVNFESALRIINKVYGTQHANASYTLNKKANLYIELGNYSMAKKMVETSIQSNFVEKLAIIPSYDSLPLNQCLNLNYLFETMLIDAKLTSLSNSDDRFSSLDKSYHILLAADSLLTYSKSRIRNHVDKLALSKNTSLITQAALDNSIQKQALKKKGVFKDEAFRFLQKSKASILLDLILEEGSFRSSFIPDSIQQLESDLKIKKIFYEQELLGVLDSSVRQSYNAELITITEKYKDFYTKVKTEYPEAFSTNNTYDLELAALQSKILKEQAIVEYHLSDTNLYIITLTQSDFHIEHKIVPKNLEGMVKALRNSVILQIKNEFIERASFLNTLLMPSSLNKKIKNIIFIPDSYLGFIPFEILLSKNVKNDTPYESLPFLIHKYTISYDYSSILFFKKLMKGNNSINNGGFIGFAPVFDKSNNTGHRETSGNLRVIERSSSEQLRSTKVAEFQGKAQYIPETETEVHYIYELFKNLDRNAVNLIGTEANEFIAKRIDYENYQFVHFATHGYFDAETPKLSGLLLAQDSLKTEDGMLFMAEIANIKLNADIVVLSACETGLGKIYKGEGLIGLTQAFITAGANNIIVSLWKVADQSSSLLMKSFYSTLLEEQNTSYSNSLRAAKLKLIKEKEFASPYFWSPFILIGK